MSELLRYKDKTFIDVARILELHHAKEFDGRDRDGIEHTAELCYECVTPWPCPTARLVLEGHTIVVEEPPPLLRVSNLHTEQKSKLDWLKENPLQWIRWGARKYPVTVAQIAGQNFLRVYRKDPETGKWGLWVCYLGEGYEPPKVQKPESQG